MTALPIRFAVVFSGSFKWKTAGLSPSPASAIMPTSLNRSSVASQDVLNN